jgi:hypothetical protein
MCSLGDILLSVKRIIWNVRSDLNFVCIGYVELHEKYVWREVVRILYFGDKILKYHLEVKGRLIGKYEYIKDAHKAAEQII